jgi:hypothetical protein
LKTGVELLGGLLDHEWRCSTFARREGLDPVGSAGTYDCVLLVEWPLPWPRDVADIPALAAAMEAIAATAPARSTRLLAIVPPDGADESAPLVTRWWRDPTAPAGAYAGSDHVCALATLPADIAALVTGDTDGGAPAGEPAPRDVIICGHGRRDACCGRAGTLLHEDVAGLWPGVRVRRCSHTGGHRFAPTSFTFPEARGWAYLDGAMLDGIVAHTGDLAALASHYRGWIALDATAQVVERELLVRHRWSWLDAEVDAVPLVGIDPDAGTAGVALEWSLAGTRGRVEAGVGIRRRVPTLDCGNPPDETTKTDPEFELRRLSIASDP